MNGGRTAIEILPDEQALARRAAKLFADFAIAAVRKSSRFSVVLSGGHTPRPLYEALASGPLGKALPWDKTHFFWGDERDVASDSPRSNFRLAWATLLSPLSISDKNIHRIRTELGNPGRVAEDYESAIRSFFGPTEVPQKPRFDLVLLGLGSDGHTASLFADGHPGPAISQKDPDRLVIAPWVPHLNEYRISLTPAALSSADHVLFLVSGGHKAGIAASLLEGTVPGARYPAQSIQPVVGEAIWLLDRPAASSLKGGAARSA